VSIHRYAAKRDANEPAIIDMLRAHGCVVWQLSGKGITDLLVMRKGKKWLADVKMPGKPTTEAQEELWEKAATKAQCAVFILRTPADAVAMLNNALAPWEPTPCTWGHPGCKIRHSMSPEDATRRGTGTKSGRSYTPPRSTPVDAAKEAEAFAPPWCCRTWAATGWKKHDPSCRGTK